MQKMFQIFNFTRRSNWQCQRNVKAVILHQRQRNTVDQGSSALELEVHFRAECGSNPNQTHLNKLYRAISQYAFFSDLVSSCSCSTTSLTVKDQFQYSRTQEQITCRCIKDASYADLHVPNPLEVPEVFVAHPSAFILPRLPRKTGHTKQPITTM